MRKIGIIGGTGVEDASCFGQLTPLTVATPFGSAHCLKGTAAGHEIYFLPGADWTTVSRPIRSIIGPISLP